MDGEVRSRYPTGAASISQGNMLQGDGGLWALGTKPPSQKKIKKTKGGITNLTSQKAGGMLWAGSDTAAVVGGRDVAGERVGVWALMQELRECGIRRERRSSKSRAVSTHPLCHDEWRHEIQSVNPEISWD